MSRSEEEIARPKSASKHELGEPLDRLSVEELRARIVILRAEILRLEAAAGAKEASRQAADAVFKR